MACEMVTNQAGLADLFRVTPATVRAWVRLGLPVLEAGGSGKSSKFDVSDAIAWREGQIVTKLAPARVPDGGVSEEEARRRKLFAEAQLAELKLDTERGALVEIEAVGEEVDLILSRVRTRLLAIPGALAVTLTNEPDPVVVRGRVFDEVAAALAELSNPGIPATEQGPRDET